MMNALPSSKWLALGLGAYALAALACSAEASSAPPSTDNQGHAGTGGTPGLGTAGTTALPTAGTTALPQGGSTAVGTAGTTAVGTAGTAAGGMSGGALAACPAPPAAGAIADLLIDNLEPDPADASGNALPHVGSRTGFWYTYGDALGSTIIPAPDPSGANPL